MRWGGVSFVCVAICCLHAASESHRLPEDYGLSDERRRRSADDRDGLALSKEIFRNITKQLRENIKKDGATDKSDHLLQNKLEDNRHYAPYQGYHHHEHHWGPYFEGELGQAGGEGTTQVTAHVGSEALLNCRVGMLKDKTVMWLRRTSDSAQLLTVGPAPYAGDNRIAVKFQYPNNWRLSVNPVKRSDAGLYMCQISTHPPRAILANLTVLPPVLTINGDQTHEIKDRFYKAGSSIKLSCAISPDYINSLVVKTYTTTTSAPTTVPPATTTTELTTKMSTVFNRIDLVLNKSWSVETTTITSTVSISTTTKKAEQLNLTTPATTVATTKSPIENNVFGISWKKQGKDFVDGITFRNLSATIKVSSASHNDSGTYTCNLQNHSRVTINVHVLIGENQAAVHHDTWNKGVLFWSQNPLIVILAIYILIMS